MLKRVTWNVSSSGAAAWFAWRFSGGAVSEPTEAGRAHCEPIGHTGGTSLSGEVWEHNTSLPLWVWFGIGTICESDGLGDSIITYHHCSPVLSWLYGMNWIKSPSQRGIFHPESRNAEMLRSAFRPGRVGFQLAVCHRNTSPTPSPHHLLHIQRCGFYGAMPSQVCHTTVFLICFAPQCFQHHESEASAATPWEWNWIATTLGAIPPNDTLLAASSMLWKHAPNWWNMAWSPLPIHGMFTLQKKSIYI